MTVAEGFSTASVPDDAANLRRIVWSSVIGTAVEWYDFFIYGTATALVFNKLFFPAFDPLAGTIAAFATYAVGFLARPLGAAIFGHFGDRVGRKAMLVVTIIIMGLGTFLIGLLPTYQQIGVAAPVLLVVLRFLQGIGLGGEWGGAVLMVVENAPKHRRGLFGSMVQVGDPIGNLAAIGMFALAVAAAGERIHGLGLAHSVPDQRRSGRRRPVDPPAHGGDTGLPSDQGKERGRKDAGARHFQDHRRPFFTAVVAEDLGDHLCQYRRRFLMSYATSQLGLSRGADPQRHFHCVVRRAVLDPLFGWMSDKIGRKTMFYASCLFSALFAFPLFWLLDTRDPTIVILTIVVAISFGQMVMFGVGAPWYSELFTARLRYTGASLGFQVGAALSGGLSPLIAASLMTWAGGATWPVSLFLIACALITAIATSVAPEMANKELT